MPENSDYFLQRMIAQFREELWPLALANPALSNKVLEMLEQQALPVFRQGAQRLVDSGHSDAPDTLPRLEGAVSELAAAVKIQIDDSTGAIDNATSTRAGGLGPIHEALNRICPLFPFC
jgi:hypothetical protein